MSTRCVDHLQDVEELLARAMEKRTVGCTQLNEQSSRSHAVFTLRLEGINDSSKLKVRPCNRFLSRGRWAKRTAPAASGRLHGFHIGGSQPVCVSAVPSACALHESLIAKSTASSTVSTILQHFLHMVAAGVWRAQPD